LKIAELRRSTWIDIEMNRWTHAGIDGHTYAPGTPLELSSPADIWLPAVVIRVCACALVSNFSSLVPWRREEGEEERMSDRKTKRRREKRERLRRSVRVSV